VGISLAAFIAVYLVVFGAGCYYIIRLVQKGPVVQTVKAYGDHGVDKPQIVSDLVSDSE
jgi:cytochrome d ubiquinol oxidase subunit I